MSSALPPGVAQGPDGKFVSVEDANRYDDVEMWTATSNALIPTDELPTDDGAINEEGHLILDMDDVIDRNEVATLLGVAYRLEPYAEWGGDNPDPDPFEVYAEVSSAATRQANFGQLDETLQAEEGRLRIVNDGTDSLDIIGRPLLGAYLAPIKDTTESIGAGGISNGDAWTGSVGDAQFHPRDEVYVNYSFAGTSEVSGANGLGVLLNAQFVFGVTQ